MDQMKTFRSMTIGQLKQLTFDYERLQQENMYLKIKYPMKAIEINKLNAPSLKDVCEDLGIVYSG